MASVATAAIYELYVRTETSALLYVNCFITIALNNDLGKHREKIRLL